MVCGKVAKNRRCHVPLMSWISKRSDAIESFYNDVFFDIEAKRTRSIVWKLISKRSEHVYIREFKYRSEANMFLLKNLNIKAKRSKLMLNCESSEAKRTYSLVEKIILKRSEHVYIKNLNIKAKRTSLIVILYIKKRKKTNFRFFFKQRAKNERVR